MPAPTPQQDRAIRAPGNVLVMAGAGTGKTSTLVARILDRALDAPQRIPLDRMLVVTFNEAAAAEMRHRLALALETRLAADPGNSSIAEQRALLDTAQVSTLHAFCLRLVRDHFHDLELDPQFTVQDEVQNRVLQSTVLREVLRSHLETDRPPSPHLATFLRRHAREDLTPVLDLVREIHEYARSLPEPDRWIDTQRRAYAEDEPRIWWSQARTGLASWAHGWIEHVRDVAAHDPANPVAPACLAPLEILVSLPTAADAAHDIADLEAALRRLVAAGDQPPSEKRKFATFRRPFEKLFEEADRLLALVAPPGPGKADSALRQDWQTCRHDVVALLDLVTEFDQAFAAARRAAAVVDFADLEQSALRLLWNSSLQLPTPLARHWQEAFDLVFVDEYQDINGAQDRILECIGRDGPRANRFLVGDIKQSIYRFRRADPRIFQTYARRWASASDDRHAVAPLTENFRSHRAILDFVNALFRSVMQSDVGGVAYDDAAELQVGAADARPHVLEHPEDRIEFHLLLTGVRPAATDLNTPSAPAGKNPDAAPAPPPSTESREDGGDSLDDSEDLDSEETQARLAAHRLRLLREQSLLVWDGTLGSTRPVRWRDMVVLHPAPRSVSERWARAFAAEGVPLDARRGGFFEALEVSDLIHLVRLLDNPRQDLPLLAVLRSPLVGMTPEELAALRFDPRADSLWEGLLALVRDLASEPSGTEPSGRSTDRSQTPPSDPDLREIRAAARTKAAGFLEAHARWRRIATQGSLAACLETVLADTGYEAWLLGQERADAKRANLRRLLGLTRQFDSFQRHGLFRFIQFLEAQSDASDRVDSAPAASGDSVRLLSMHQSKGLEFPVVVAAGLGRRFNVRDLAGDWLLDPEFGICPPIVPDAPHRRYHSLPRCLAGFRQRQDLIGEQIRLLYVACTRAAERLLLVGCARESRLETWVPTSGPLAFRTRIEAQSPLDWVGPTLPSLARHPGLYAEPSGSLGTLSWRLWRAAPSTPEPAHPPRETPRALSPAPGPPAPRSQPSTGRMQLDFESLLESSPNLPPAVLAARRLDWTYPWQPATREPAKAAVTALRRQWLEDEETSAPPTAAPPPAKDTSRHAVLPNSGRQQAIERGLAHHLFNERVDLARTATREDLQAEISRLSNEGWLPPEQAASLDLEGLLGFWSTPLAASLRAHPRGVQRELPFTLRLRALDATRLGGPRDAAGFGPDDFQVVQGVVDLAWVGLDQIWIVDFKTDQVGHDGVQARAKEYGAQLRIYAHALSGIYGLPVTRCWLYFFATRDLVDVPMA